MYNTHEKSGPALFACRMFYRKDSIFAALYLVNPWRHIYKKKQTHENLTALQGVLSPEERSGSLHGAHYKGEKGLTPANSDSE